MDQQNIDRLFREKLGQMEAMPSTNAWSKVEKQIRPKKTPIIYWVAASVSLLLISWMVWPDAAPQELTPIASEVSHPVYQGTPNFVVPLVEEDDQQKERMDAPQKVPQKKEPLVQFAMNTSEDQKAEIIKDVVPEIEEIDTKTVVAEGEVEKPEIKEAVEQPTFSAVKITYIASSGKNMAETTQKNDSTGALKKFIAFAEKINPGDILADMKTAKDNLLNGGFKSKKDRHSL